MSSYLTFYLIPKKVKTFENMEGVHEIKLSEGVPLKIDCYARNNEMYHYFHDNLSIAFCGEETKYTRISPEDFRTVLDAIQRDIEENENSLKVYYTVLGTNKDPDIIYDTIREVMTLEKEVKDLKSLKEYVKNFKIFISSATNEFDGDFIDCVANIS